MTLTIDGVESDRRVAGFVEVNPSGATLDGWAQVYLDGEGYDTDLLELGPGDEDRIEQALCDQAFRDLEDEFCDLDPDEYDDDFERYCA